MTSRTIHGLVALAIGLGGALPLLTVGSAVADTPLPPDCSTTTYDGFTGATDLTLNGRAALAGDRLRVTYAANDGAGSAFTTQKIQLHDGGSFSTRFTYQFSNPGGGGADGLVFTVQNVANNVGSIGGGLGYQGISHSIGVELDDWYNYPYDINDNHVGIDVNGDIASNPAADLAGLGINLDDGAVGHVWVDYDGATKDLQVRVSSTDSRPATALLSKTVDLPAILGDGTTPAQDAYLGFTAATGAANANFDVLDWTFNNCYQPVGVDASPTVDAGGPYAGHKGEAVSLDGTVTDDNAGVTQQWSYAGPAGATCTFSDATAQDPSVTCDTLGTYQLTLTGTDSIGQPATDTADLVLSNRAPVAGALDTSAASACQVDATLHYADDDAGDTHTVAFDWGDGNQSAGTVDEAASTGSGSHTYAHAGTYTIAATVSDGEASDGASASYPTKNAAGFLAPIGPGADRTVFKLGSTIPVKITVSDCDGAAVTTLRPSVQLTKLDSSTPGGTVETPAEVTATNGRQMVWTGDHYQFNLSTKRSQFAGGADLTMGSYRLTVTDPSLVGAASVVIDLR